MPAQIFLVPNFHYDVAYLKRYEEYLPICYRNIDEVLRLLGENEDYRFLIEQSILLEEYWNAFPEKREALAGFAKEGRLAVAPGMFVMPDINLPTGESMYMQAKIGKDWLQGSIGIEPKVCWIADCWGHHAQLPQILSQSGYEYYVMWRSMRRDVMRNDFLWEGIDGTRIKTHWLAKNYSGMRFPEADEMADNPDHVLTGCGEEDFRALFEEFQRYGKSDLVLSCNGGDFLFPQSSAINIARRLNATGRVPEIRFSTPQEYLDQVDWQSMPTVTGEFNSSMQGTITSNIRIKQNSRQLSNALLALETLSLLASDTPSDYTDIWRLILKQQFHDIICGTVCDAALKDCLDEFATVAQRIKEETNYISSQGGKEMIFNSLSFSRTVLVERDGREMELTLPALGFTELSEATELPLAEEATLPCTFENNFYKAQLDADGYIISLVSKPDGSELVCPLPCPFGALSIQVDNGDLWLNFDGPVAGGSMESALTQNHPDPFDRMPHEGLVNSLTIQSNISKVKALRRSDEELWIEQEGSIWFWRLDIPFTTQIRMRRNSSRIEYKTILQPMGKHYRIRAAFPTTIKNGLIRHEIPYGIQVRSSHEFPAQNWADYSGDSTGLALLNRGTAGNNVDDGIMLLTLFRSAAMEYKAPSADSFSEGIEHVFEYALLPHGPNADVDIIRAGHDFATPPIAVKCSAESKTGWGVDAENVFASALRRSDDGVFIRLYEATGKPTEVKLSLPAGVCEYAESDGIERPVSKYQPCGSEIQLDMRGFEIRNLLFR